MIGWQLGADALVVDGHRPRRVRPLREAVKVIARVQDAAGHGGHRTATPKGKRATAPQPRRGSGPPHRNPEGEAGHRTASVPRERA